MTNENKILFWNTRASLGDVSGTNDFLLKQLEVTLLSKRVPDASHILDIGCGNGETLIVLAKNKQCTGVGIDFSEQMIFNAKERSKKSGTNKNLNFLTMPISKLDTLTDIFDIAITERSLQNLDNEQDQYQAFQKIMNKVKPGGRYFMIESSVDGLERINELRVSFDLEPISPPWHNIFLKESTVENWSDENIILEEIFPFSSTYYFFSRVVYAKLAHGKGEALQYDSDINLLSTQLPVLGNFGPTRLWQWYKKK